MNHQLQTLKFLVVAVGALGVAYLTSVMTQPDPVKGFGLIGEEFFPDLSPGEVTGIRVVTSSEDTATHTVFKVAFKDGAYRIESRNDYPADGKEQLGKTSNALLGVKREALISRISADHEKYGVVDPLDRDLDTTEGRGHRITLYKEDDIPVADLIVGSPVEGQAKQNYARLVGGAETFIVTLDFEVSTKFSDWVEDDLLKLDRDNLISIQSQKSTSDRETMSVKTDVLAHVTRTSSSDTWHLKGLKDTEEVDADRLRNAADTLGNLKLIGVSERPEIQGKRLLNSDLTIPKEFQRQMGLISQVIQGDLQRRGFRIFPSKDELKFIADEGELIAGTKNGIEYHLSFGSVFSGTEEEIQLGGADTDSKDKDASDDKDKKDAGDNEATGPSPKTTDLRGRYVFARTAFNKDLLGPAPAEPKMPLPPEGVKVDENGNVIEDEPVKQPTAVDEKSSKKEAEAKDDSGCDEPADKTKAVDEKAPDKKVDETTDGKKPNVPAKPDAKAKPPVDPKDKTTVDDGKTKDPKSTDDTKLPDAIPKVDPIVEYKNALSAYRAGTSTYERDVTAYEKKIEDGQAEVEKLNKRFVDWYYVISVEDFDKLNLSRDQVVKAKVDPAKGPNDANPLGPGPLGGNPLGGLQDLLKGKGPLITPKQPEKGPTDNKDDKAPTTKKVDPADDKASTKDDKTVPEKATAKPADKKGTEPEAAKKPEPKEPIKPKAKDDAANASSPAPTKPVEKQPVPKTAGDASEVKTDSKK